MLPNRFPDAGEQPEYNTFDATLWYFEAIYHCYKKLLVLDKGRAMRLIADLFPVLAEIVEWHKCGTRYNIHLDSDDGLLAGGVEGSQLTWMDAMVDGCVVTPRIGKPVEINALWYSAMQIMGEFAEALGQQSNEYHLMAAASKSSFSRFWEEKKGYCFDVIDGPMGNDSSLRPNQVLALDVAFSPIPSEKQAQILKVVERKLLTPQGLRSLSQDDPQFVPVYGGDIWSRDKSYHQGTVWGWLIGPYLRAHYKVFSQKAYVVEGLENYVKEIYRHGLGSISEIFDGTAPHMPRGCIAQAWSVAAALWTWDLIR
jgi:predicted glycogen debranching enzyme